VTVGHTVTAHIERVGVEGDGVATSPDGTKLYIPDALPGEAVRARPVRRMGDGWFAPHDGVLAASSARATPPCVHFGKCGGCVLQHWQEAPYLDWKVGQVRAALTRAGFAVPAIAPIQMTPPRSRRRMDLALARKAGRVLAGLHWRGEEAIEDLRDCVVLAPRLSALIGPLRTLGGTIKALRRTGSAIGNLLDDGVDLLLRTDSPLDAADREALIAFARAQNLVRLSWAPPRGSAEPVIVLRPPRLTLSGVVVEPPPGAFLQASLTGEAAISAAVVAGVTERLPTRARIAELYAGCGTLTFALAADGRVRVAAFEGDAPSAAALRQAANRSGLAGRIEVGQRDLVRQPLLAKALAGFAAVVLDPPHAGAAVPIAQIAAAKVPVVVYVSCNPATLGRDAGVLRDAGYRLDTVTPIDQFLWSARIEMVAVFRQGL
jgi:23S rRNA (uracil1939-C5)-methyltransferase